MSAEAVIVNADSNVHYFTIVNKAIPKGTLMVLSADPRTVTLHSAVEQIPMGITVEQIRAGDGQVRVACVGRGIYDMVADGAITLGYLVTPGSAVNDVRVIGLDTVSISQAALRQVLGKCLETASDNEVVQVLVTLW